jgi:cell division protein FtsW
MKLQPVMINNVPSRRVMIPPLPYDLWLIATVLLLLGFGLLMVASASIEVSDHQLHQPFYFFYKQLIYMFIGIVMGSIVVQFEMEFWEKTGGMVLVSVMMLLALVLFPGIGHSVNGSTRWIGLGPVGIQVSELAKIAVVIYMASYLYRFNQDIKISFIGFVKPMGVLTIILALLMREPDFGAAVVIIATALGMMFLAGMRLRYFIGLLIVVLVSLAFLAISAPYRLLRLTSFMNPWEHPFNSGYQLTQSLIAFGRGGWFGVGLGNSIQKLFYLPEAHTDFLFAVIAEELGLLGVIAVITLFSFLIAKIFLIGRRAQRLGQHFSGFVAYGIGLWFVIQFTVSMGVNSGLLPTKGLTLPLMSYGGSSMLVNCITIAILLRIDYENRMLAVGLR